jgi:hypothetical protein
LFSWSHNIAVTPLNSQTLPCLFNEANGASHAEENKEFKKAFLEVFKEI